MTGTWTPNWQIVKEFRFEAAHRLPNHDGKCRNLHGHSYIVKVCVEGNKLWPEGSGPKEGMILDFGDISGVWNTLRPSLDHTLLNDFMEIPTAENLAQFLYYCFKERFEFFDEGGIKWVRVYETSTSYAEYTEHEE